MNLSNTELLDTHPQYTTVMGQNLLEAENTLVIVSYHFIFTVK